MAHTAYRLPDWLGGHEVEVTGRGPGDMVTVYVQSENGGAGTLTLDGEHLVKVESPEPENMATVFIRYKDGHDCVAARRDDYVPDTEFRWFKVGSPSSFKWSRLMQDAQHVIRLVPERAS